MWLGFLWKAASAAEKRRIQQGMFDGEELTMPQSKRSEIAQPEAGQLLNPFIEDQTITDNKLIYLQKADK